MNNRRIRITYDIVTEESAQHGDYAETGWIDEEGIEIAPDADDIEYADGDELAAIVDAAKNVIEQNGLVEASSSKWYIGTWYSQVDCEPEEKRYNFHLVGFTDAEEQAIFNALKW